MKLIDWINEIIIIDNDPSQQFLLKKLIHGVDKGIPIHGFFECKEALDFLESKVDVKSKSKKSLIFLDLNLPEMEGFQFLSHYRSLDSQIKANYEVIILISSIRPSKKLVIIDFSELKGFYPKPVDSIILEKILQRVASEPVK